MSGEGPGFDPKLNGRFANAFGTMSEEDVAKATAERRAGKVADFRLRWWAMEERGLVALLVETLVGCEFDRTLGSIKVYDDGGRCLGYLPTIVDGLKRRLEAAVTIASEPVPAAPKAAK